MSGSVSFRRWSIMKETNNRNKLLIGTWAWGTGYNGSSMVFGKKQDENVLFCPDYPDAIT